MINVIRPSSKQLYNILIDSIKTSEKLGYHTKPQYTIQRNFNRNNNRIRSRGRGRGRGRGNNI